MVVVFCVVDVVIKQSSFVVMKNVTRILDLFLGFIVLGMSDVVGEAGHVDDVFVGDSFAGLLLGLGDAGFDSCDGA